MVYFIAKAPLLLKLFVISCYPCFLYIYIYFLNRYEWCSPKYVSPASLRKIVACLSRAHKHTPVPRVLFITGGPWLRSGRDDGCILLASPPARFIPSKRRIAPEAQRPPREHVWPSFYLRHQTTRISLSRILHRGWNSEVGAKKRKTEATGAVARSVSFTEIASFSSFLLFFLGS